MANKRSGGGNYDQFLVYVSTYIKKGDVKEIVKKLSSEEYQASPNKVRKEIDEFIDAAYEKGVERGKGTKTERQQAISKRNFKEALEKTVFRKAEPQTRFEYEGKEAELQPLLDPWLTAKTKYLVPETVPGKTKKFIETLDKSTSEGVPGEELSKLSPTRAQRLFEKRLALAEKSGNISSLIELKKSQERLWKKGNGVIPSNKAYANMGEVEKILDKYRDKTHQFNLKSPEELKEILAWKGVDVTRLKDDYDVREAAKREGIGLRKYQKSKDELIKELTELVPSLTREDVEEEKLTNEELKNRIQSRSRQIFSTGSRRVKRPLFSDLDKKSEDDVKKDWLDNPSLPDFESTKQRYVDEDKKLYPFLSPEELEDRANKRLLMNVKGSDVYEKELLRRFLSYEVIPIQKGRKKIGLAWIRREEPKKEATIEDLEKLQYVTNNDFKFHLGDDLSLPKDQRYLSKDLFSQYRKNLKENLERLNEYKQSQEERKGDEERKAADRFIQSSIEESEEESFPDEDFENI